MTRSCGTEFPRAGRRRGSWPSPRVRRGLRVYFICIGQTSIDAGLWPTVANLVVAVAVTIPVAARAGVLPGPRSAPRLAVLGGVALGLADVTVTTALQEGPLTVASVLTNLYPIVTIALGVAVVGERIHPWHAAGIVLALAGVSMIAQARQTAIRPHRDAAGPVP